MEDTSNDGGKLFLTPPITAIDGGLRDIGLVK